MGQVCKCDSHSIVAHKRSICRTYFTRQDRRDIVQNAQDAVLLCLTYEQLLKDMEEITCFFFSLITIAEYYVVGDGHGLTRKRGDSRFGKDKALLFRSRFGEPALLGELLLVLAHLASILLFS